MDRCNGYGNTPEMMHISRHKWSGRGDPRHSRSCTVFSSIRTVTVGPGVSPDLLDLCPIRISRFVFGQKFLTDNIFTKFNLRDTN